MESGKYLSWGRNFRYRHEIKKLFWLTDNFSTLFSSEKKVLPYGLGRSYGDSCLNGDGVLIDVSGLNHSIFFDRAAGVIRCEAGITLAQILEIIVPEGWFLPVTPGTKYVTLGGAIANDVHGKNHHLVGTFGCFVNAFEILRSDGERIICSPTKNSGMFAATIGGLGLTGLVLWAEIRLLKASPIVTVESIKVKDLDGFYRLTEQDRGFTYSVAWMDCTAGGASLGRGIFMRGNHADPAAGSYKKQGKAAPICSVPIDAPGFLLNRYTVKAFNFAYYNKQFKERATKNIFFDPFFYPLDIVDNWNRIYGRKGFYQYQFVIPEKNWSAVVKVFEMIAESKMASFLAVLKKFGEIKSPGILSFPRPGITLALDFVNQGERTKDLCRRLDEIVLGAQGRLYPAKDALMSPDAFKAFYPEYQEFKPYRDSKFSSNFIRRVTKDE